MAAAGHSDHPWYAKNTLTSRTLALKAFSQLIKRQCEGQRSPVDYVCRVAMSRTQLKGRRPGLEDSCTAPPQNNRPREAPPFTRKTPPPWGDPTPGRPCLLVTAEAQDPVGEHSMLLRLRR